jgi:hypothetical protein
MDKNSLPKADTTRQTSPEVPFTTFIQLDGRSAVPSQFKNKPGADGTFPISLANTGSTVAEPQAIKPSLIGVCLSFGGQLDEIRPHSVSDLRAL